MTPTSLPATVPLTDLMALSVPEKLTLIGALWESIDEQAVNADAPPEWHLQELERRLEADRVKPATETVHVSEELIAELDRRKAAAVQDPSRLIVWESLKRETGQQLDRRLP